MSCQPLSKPERAKLIRLEKTIAVNLKATEKCCAAFVTIRNERLYRATHATFAQYCQERWKITHRSVNRQIAQLEVSENLGRASQEPLEISVRQAAILAALPDEAAQRQVYEQAEDPEDAAELQRLAEEWKDQEASKIQEEEAEALEKARQPSGRKAGRDLLERIEETVGRLEKLWAKIDQAEFADELAAIKTRLGAL